MTERDQQQPIPPPDPASPDAPTVACTPRGDDPEPAATRVESGVGRRSDPPSAMFPSVSWTPPRSDAIEGVTPPPASPVVPPRRGSAIRWVAALLVTVLVVGVAFAGVFLLTGQSAPSGVAGYMPADAVVYTDIRLDLPGDQRQKLGEFLSKFPGFADQSTLDAKLDDALDRIVRGASGDKQTWSADIKPWFGGEIGFASSRLPDASHRSDFRGLFVVTVTDPAKAKAWLTNVFTEAGAKTTTEPYKGIDIVSGGDASIKAGYAVTGKVILAGDLDSVKAAIDSGGNSGFAQAEHPRAAAAAFDGDSIAYVYMDMRRYFDWALSMSAIPGASAAPMFSQAYLDRLPSWMAMRLVARGDGLVVEAASPAVATKVSRENRLSAIAPHLPPSTIAVLEAHDVGTGVLDAINAFRSEPSSAEAFKQIDQAAAVLGGFDAIVGWMNDASIVVTRDGTTIGGGAVFTAKDRAAGERLLTTLRSYAVIAGGQMGVKVTDAPYAGTTITTVDFGDLRDLGAIANIPATGLQGRFSITYTTTPDLIVIGVGDTFVKSVLDAKAGASLADSPRFKSALDGAGARNVGYAWVDIAAVRELIENAARTSGAPLTEYERDVKPYLEHLDSWVETATADGDLNRITMVLIDR